MNILALDLATKTGWASISGGIKTSGVQVFDLKRGESPGMRFLRFRAWLSEICRLTKPDVIAYEQAHHRGGAATQLTVGMMTDVLAHAADIGADVTGVHTATLKKWATGNGRASKEDMIAESKRRGWSPVDDNEADASLILERTIEAIGA